MMQSLQANSITLATLREQFRLTLARDPQFFSEWQSLTEPLTELEIRSLDRIKSNFENLLEEPPLLESAVKMVVLSGLLDLAGFYQPPFRIRTEASIQIRSMEDEENGVMVKGAIDVLVVKDRLWILVIESKMSDFSLAKALPQALAYLISSNQPTGYGLITNGSEFLFLKLSRSATPQYGTSRVFSLFTPNNELIQVLQILKRLGQLIQ